MQVWKRPGWPGSSLDGIFVQLESLRTKRIWFVPFKDGLLGCVAQCYQYQLATGYS